MRLYSAIVRYRYRKHGSIAWISTSTTVNVIQQSDLLAMQAVRKSKPAGVELELVEIRWR